MIYKKKALTYEDQLQQLKNRGLIINNDAKVLKYLQNISYYRLEGYWWPLQADKETHQFKPKSSFKQVIDLYNFDTELRMLIFSVIEKIEISLRTKLIYHMSHAYGPWWFQDTTLFKDTPALIKTLEKLREEVERSKETYMKEHRRKYKDDKRYPPAWKTLELTSFGGLSKLYGNIKNTIPVKDAIAQEFGAVNHTFIPSWLQAISQIRNICAHHGRLWNKNLPASVKLLPNPPNSWIEEVPRQHEFKHLYVHLCIMKYLLNTIHPKNQFSQNLDTLLSNYSSVDSNALGFKANWQQEPLWQ